MANAVFGFKEVTLDTVAAAVVGTPTGVSRVILRAATANTGEVTVGDSATCTFPVGEVASAAVQLPIHELSMLYAKSSVKADKLEIAWFKGR